MIVSAGVSLMRVRTSKFLNNPVFAYALFRWISSVGFVVVSIFIGWRLLRQIRLTTSFSEQLNLVTAFSTVALVVITALYAYFTAKTLEHLREERLSVAEPLLYLTLKTRAIESDNIIKLVVENFGRGAAIRVKGESRSRWASVGGKVVREEIDSLDDIIGVGDCAHITLRILPENLELLPVAIGDRRKNSLSVRLVYEDAKRNIYVYQLAITAYMNVGRISVQPFTEKLWRVAYDKRHHIFDQQTVLESGLKPIFYRSLYSYPEE